MSCPRNSITYNGTLCACPPGQLLNRTSNGCAPFEASNGIITDSGVDYAISFPETIFSFDSIKKFTQSQAVFLEATLVLLVSWLLFCFFMRFMKVGDGRNIWFRIRWWISRLDICFATRHWLDDQKVVVKRKTELGGTFSIASLILFTGLFAALLYQIISKRTIEVHNVRAANAPDLASFINDMEFNITTISSMSCSNLRGLGTLVTGNPGFIDYRVAPLSNFVDYSCQNTSIGPTIAFKCSKCQLFHDYMYISWQFVDLPNNPATAVGFQFNVTAKNPANRKHMSYVSGMLKNGSTFDDRPVTFRGVDANILKFNLFPRVYHNLHDLRLIQPLFHEFLPGSFYRDTAQLQASLESSNGRLINTTLFVNYLSAYVVEIERQNIMGPVSFLADLGGLYCISIGIFFYFLVQCEFRIKKLRNEDSILRKIRSRRKAQEHWDKLRKYVMYTWGFSTLVADSNNNQNSSSCCNCMTPSIRGNGSRYESRSSQKRGQQNRMDSINFNKKVSIPSEKNTTLKRQHTREVKSCMVGTASNPDERVSCSRGEPPLHNDVLGSTNNGKKHFVASCEGDASRPQAFSLSSDNIIPLPPPLELKAASQVGMADIQKNFQRLYDYNVLLRENFIATQSMLCALAAKSSSPASKSQT